MATWTKCQARTPARPPGPRSTDRDVPALRALAVRDSAAPLSGALLVAVVEDRIWAALELDGARVRRRGAVGVRRPQRSARGGADCGSLSAAMRRLLPLLAAVLAAAGAVAGCGSGDDADGGAASGSSTTPRGNASPYVVVTSLLGKPLPGEPGCAFERSFAPDSASVASYDGALSLTVTCAKRDGVAPGGQIVNRAGRKPASVTCRRAADGQSFCIYVPSTTVALYFTGPDQAAARRRLERLMAVVEPLPMGVSPLSGASAR